MSDMPLKQLHENSLSRAIEKAKHYRLLNDPENAESICLDILDVDPDHQEALVTLVLSVADQFDGGSSRLKEVRGYLDRLKDEYDQLYYAGLACEKNARASVARNKPGSNFAAYDWFQDAMEYYEKADGLTNDENDDAILRWNACVRTIRKRKLKPRPEDNYVPYGD
ncbi:MAG: hypothetical protein AAF456_12260 [Planctomycetota bacterium]